MPKIRVHAENGNYEVVCGRGVLAQLPANCFGRSGQESCICNFVAACLEALGRADPKGSSATRVAQRS